MFNRCCAAQFEDRNTQNGNGDTVRCDDDGSSGSLLLTDAWGTLRLPIVSSALQSRGWAARHNCISFRKM